MARIAVIVNPASCSGRSGETRRLIQELATKEGCEIMPTSKRGHATEIAVRLAAAGFDRVVAVGGDGTLNEVANALAYSETALAAVPAGTGNDWVRTVAIPHDPNVAWHIAIHGRITETDLAEVEGHGYCLNVLGAGLDADVARRISNARGIVAKLGPKSRYVVSSIGAFARYKRATVRITIDGRETRTVPKVLLTAIGVAKCYGSGMQILPHAKIDDGLLDFIWGARVGAFELPGLLSKVYKGTHTDHRRVTLDRGKTITLESDSPVPFHIDGDVRGTLPIKVTVRPKALRIVVP
jgi:YegS/Rv2252/BmrU family lipid kinase